MSISLIGKGGFAKEMFYHLYKTHTVKIVNELDYNLYALNSSFLICIGDVITRNEVYNKYKDLDYFTYVHDKTIIEQNRIGKGSIICKGSILTTNIVLGKHCQLNLNTTIGHDVTLGDFVTCSPGVNISGNCIIGNNVSIGTNSSIKEHTIICDHVIIGMGSVVLKNITDPGTYFGNPAKKWLK